MTETSDENDPDVTPGEPPSLSQHAPWLDALRQETRTNLGRFRTVFWAVVVLAVIVNLMLPEPNPNLVWFLVACALVVGASFEVERRLFVHKLNRVMIDELTFIAVCTNPGLTATVYARTVRAPENDVRQALRRLVVQQRLCTETLAGTYFPKDPAM